jgi:hypothetical protein
MSTPKTKAAIAGGTNQGVLVAPASLLIKVHDLGEPLASNIDLGLRKNTAFAVSEKASNARNAGALGAVIRPYCSKKLSMEDKSLMMNHLIVELVCLHDLENKSQRVCPTCPVCP